MSTMKTAIRRSTLGALPSLVGGSGRPLVLLGGLTPENGMPRGIGLRFEYSLIAAYADGLEVHWAARPTGLPIGTTLSEVAAITADGIREQFGGEPVALLGISTGGSIAQQLAAEHPDVVRRLTLMSTGCRLDPETRESQRRLAEMAERGDRAAVFTEYGRDLVPPHRGRRLAGLGMRLIGPRIYAGIGDLSDLAMTLQAEDAFDLQELPPIAAPTLVIAGGRDRFYSQATLRDTVRLIPNCTFSLYESRGHITLLSDRKAIAEAASFCRG
jgi:pimeloyl-ACP methyl ester carboxylesterase